MKAIALLTLLALVTTAHAVPADRIALSSAQPATFTGALDVLLQGPGAASTYGRVTSFAGAADGMTGRIVVWEWEDHRVTTSFNQNLREARATTHALAGGSLSHRVADEAGSFAVVLGPDGALTLRGDVATEGVPRRLYRDVGAEVHVAQVGPPGPQRLDTSWRAGWVAFGTMDAARLPMDAFPTAEEPRIHLNGSVRFSLFGGNVTFTDAAGHAHALRLGSWEAQDETLPSQPLVGRVAYRMLVFEGTVQRAHSSLAPAWGMAGADATWVLDGILGWRGAHGDAMLAGKRVEFADAVVEVEATAEFRVAPGALAGASRYEGEGAFRALRIDGARVTGPPASGADYAAPATLTLLALALLALTKLGQGILAHGAAALYTRIAPADVLTHPRRRLIHDEVTATPGIHQRDLHRRVGGAWGAFRFHLRILERAGHLRLHRQGGYALVFRPDANVTGPATRIPHPLARALYDSLPASGEAVPLKELPAKLGGSRELVSYHIRCLEARGLVRRVPLDGSVRGVARVTGPGWKGLDPSTLPVARR